MQQAVVLVLQVAMQQLLVDQIQLEYLQEVVHLQLK
jgi:hypothetical protein